MNSRKILLAACIAIALPATAHSEDVALFDALGVTNSTSNTPVVYNSKTVTIYCGYEGGTATLVRPDSEKGIVIDNFITAGNNNVSLCAGGAALLSGYTGTNCHIGAGSNRAPGTAVDSVPYYDTTNVVTGSYDLNPGQNDVTFKLWDYGVIYAHSAIALRLPDDCSASPLTINVGIDIKPGSYPNSINLCSKGVVTVAVLGSAEFDVTNINLDTLTFGSVAPRMVGKGNKSSCSIEDVSGNFLASMEGAGDGFPDLVCQYETVELGELSTTVEAKVAGELWDGGKFEGSDSINIVKDGCL